MFDKEIKNLVSNIEKPKTPLILDLILEGGAFNGSYELGVCYFLKELERQEYIKVNRISGASIGSIIGGCYLLDKLDSYYDSYNKLREEWKNTLSVGFYKNLLQNTIEDMSDNVLELVNDKLYVSYNDIVTRQQCVKSSYDTTNELIHSIFKSCHIPYISSENLCEEEFFIDGGVPFIFIDREKEKISQNKDILYVSISHFNILFDSLNISKEVSLDGRILNGILNCYNLFMKNENNTMCSFMSKWKIQQYTILRMKQACITLLVYFVILLKYFSSFIHPLLQNFQLYNRIFDIVKNLGQDILIKCVS